MTELAMFPLGTVLFPRVFLPLHIFEPRYRQLARHCVDGDQEFGVVLIERGSEVGGRDVRTSVGTVARIVEAVELDDGRWVLGAVGTRRIRVREWLPENEFGHWDGLRLRRTRSRYAIHMPQAALDLDKGAEVQDEPTPAERASRAPSQG